MKRVRSVLNITFCGNTAGVLMFMNGTVCTLNFELFFSNVIDTVPNTCAGDYESGLS